MIYVRDDIPSKMLTKQKVFFPKSFCKAQNVFTGLSEFHKLVLSVFKLHFSEGKAKEISYRNFWDFKEDNFNPNLQNRLFAESVEEYVPFEKGFLVDVLNKHASLKKKVVRANHAPYITKILRKTIMKRSYLEKVYFKKKTPDSLIKFKKQKNYCNRLYKKERKKYFESLNPQRIRNNKSFWKNIQPFFSEKRKINYKIILAGIKENTIFEDNLVSEELNKFFENAARDLEINANSYIIDTDGNEINSV